MDNKHLVINLIGGPGSGKSTTMAGVFYWLKKHMVNCEMATEYAKDKVWEEDYRAMDDQIYIIGKQFHRISRLIDKVDIVIMDTSLLSSIIYDKNHSEALKQLCIEAFNKFNNKVYFIERDDISYETSGRRETSDKAKEIDNAYKELMDELGIEYKCLHNSDSVDTIINDLIEDKYLDENKAEDVEMFKNVKKFKKVKIRKGDNLAFKTILYNKTEVKDKLKEGLKFTSKGFDSEFIGWSRIDGKPMFKVTNLYDETDFANFMNSKFVMPLISVEGPEIIDLVIGAPVLISEN